MNKEEESEHSITFLTLFHMSLWFFSSNSLYFENIHATWSLNTFFACRCNHLSNTNLKSLLKTEIFKAGNRSKWDGFAFRSLEQDPKYWDSGIMQMAVAKSTWSPTQHCMEMGHLADGRNPTSDAERLHPTSLYFLALNYWQMTVTPYLKLCIKQAESHSNSSKLVPDILAFLTQR